MTAALSRDSTPGCSGEWNHEKARSLFTGFSNAKDSFVQIKRNKFYPFYVFWEWNREKTH
jgi:hypothetical protein